MHSNLARLTKELEPRGSFAQVSALFMVLANLSLHLVDSPCFHNGGTKFADIHLSDTTWKLGFLGFKMYFLNYILKDHHDLRLQFFGVIFYPGLVFMQQRFIMDNNTMDRFIVVIEMLHQPEKKSIDLCDIEDDLYPWKPKVGKIKSGWYKLAIDSYERQ